MPMFLLTMSFVSKKSGQLNVSISPEIASTLETIRTKHGVPPPELVRQLLDSVVRFYEKNGYFAFPVHVVPDAEFLKAVKGTKSFLHTSDAGLPAVAGTDAEFETIRKSRTVAKQTTKTGTHK